MNGNEASAAHRPVETLYIAPARLCRSLGGFPASEHTEYERRTAAPETRELTQSNGQYWLKGMCAKRPVSTPKARVVVEGLSGGGIGACGEGQL